MTAAMGQQLLTAVIVNVLEDVLVQAILSAGYV